MALVKPYIFQIVGYKNSGKSTFIKMLLSMLTENGLKVATIKHHGHGGRPDVIENTDSARHIKAGASASLVDGGGRLILQTEGVEWTLEEKIHLVSNVFPDVILMEGYKMEKYPKAVFIRDQQDLTLLNELTNIKLVLYKDNLEIDFQKPSFSRDDPKAVQWLVNYINVKTI